jgi:hypothetical protein
MEEQSMDMLDIYTDYLICQNKYADMVDGEFSNDNDDAQDNDINSNSQFLTL